MTMRALALAALAALLTCSGLDRPAAAQSGGRFAAPPGVGELQIEWQVRNRFRLFRREADFQRHVAADRAGSQLAAEHWLNQGTEGRGWAEDMVDHLCLDVTGALLDTCERDGERESYLAPKTHRVLVRLTGAVPPDATCNWSFDDGTIPPQQINAGCSAAVQLRLRYGRPTIAAVGITRPDNSVDSVSTEIMVRDLLIAGLGDSVAAGEGNPDRPIKLADEGFCFRRFLGGARSEYFRPSRLGYESAKACDDNPSGPGPAATNDWANHGARWMSAACHRSLYSHQVRTALALAVQHPHVAVTFIPLACSGASIESGMLDSQGASDCPLTGPCASTVPPQVERLRDTLEWVRRQNPNRKLDLILLTIGANDVKFSGLVADVITTAGVERVLFNQGGMITSVSKAQQLLDGDFPRDFVKLRFALKPLVGGNLSRVVFVSYGHPAMQNNRPCPGGRDGLDVHPAFTADGARLRNVTDFVLSRFLPRVRALALCEAGPKCGVPETDRMSFVDSHLVAFADHGFCARSPSDPVFDRECFLPDGNSFNGDPVSAATAPLNCSRRPGEFRPYAPRARWIRTPNDSYFTAMAFPRGLPSVMQPSNIHDATWGAMSAVWGGAFHPSAEGQAVMADAALPVARDVLGLRAPPAVTAAPLPPPSAVSAPAQ
jgi:hypothetical protein